MSLTIRGRALAASILILVILLAPAAYSLLMLREISRLASALANADARAGVMAARLSDLFSEAYRSARLLRVDPVFRPGFERAVDEMLHVLVNLERDGDPSLREPCAGAREALGGFRDRALAASADEAGLEPADVAVRGALSRLTAEVRRVAAERSAEAERLAQRGVTLTLLATGVAVIVAAGLWAALLRALGRPLRDLAAGTERIARGRFDQKIPVRADDELGRLAAAFNRMAEALGELDRMKAEFLSAASHGLRTPLTCAKGHLGSLASGRQGPLSEEQRRALQRTEEEIDRVSRFVEQLLDLGRLRSGRLPLSMREAPAAAFFTSIARSFEPLAEQKGIAYRIHVEEGVPARITADPDRLGEALINLLGNAFKYTPPGGGVRMTVSGEEGWVRVEVADNGPGIPAAEVPLIFEKYYRGGGVTAEGAGLGLAIARGIVERHGGTIWAESSEGAGARFIFRVPVHPPRAAEGGAA